MLSAFRIPNSEFRISKGWHLSPEGEAVFGSAGPAFDKWLAAGVAEVVKHGPHRTVYRVPLDSGTVYVKQCRINGPRAWAREVIRPPKARLEFENAARLRALGIGAAVPLAWGTLNSRWPGESFLITRDLAPAVPFTEFMESRYPLLAPQAQRALRQQLARGLGYFLALLHENGIAHPDPHPGNVLVEWAVESGQWAVNTATQTVVLSAHCPLSTAHSLTKFSLLDVHAIRFGPPLSWQASRANLILFNRWFQIRASRTDRARFWKSYCEARAIRADAKELERTTLASNRRFWLARTARYTGTHRSIRKVRAGNVRGLALRDLDDAFLRTLLADPDALFAHPGTTLLKQCVSSTVAELEMPTPTGPRAVILKRVNSQSVLDAVKNQFRSSAVRRSWLQGHGLCERWLPTPRPLAMFHRYRAGILPAEGYLLCEKVPHGIGLPEAVKACRDARIWRAWGERLARVIRTMHDRGVSHRDLKAPNVMLANAATPVLIDLVGVRASADAVPFARRAKELARLNASFLAMPHITRTERLRFLRTYLSAGSRDSCTLGRTACVSRRVYLYPPAYAGGSTDSIEKPSREADWKNWWNAVSAATAAKVAKNRRSGRAIG